MWYEPKPLIFFHIEGLHEAVRSYTRTILPRRLVFLYGAV